MKFSVIIPTYNRIDLLEKAIESVNGQTYDNYELIVVNDNPEEKVQIDALITKFDKTTVIHHAEPKGGNAARNSGISNSHGDLIAFLDDDDVWLPEKLDAHLKAHEKEPGAGLIFSDCLYVYNNKFVSDQIASSPVPPRLVEEMGKAQFCPATSSIVSIKRECVEKCGLFDDSLVSFQDWDYWFRIAHKFPFAHIPKVLVHYRQHTGDRTSHNENKRRKALDQICNKWGEEINVKEFKRNSIVSIYNKNSRSALMAGKKFTALKKSFKLLDKEILSVRSIKTFIKLILELIFKRK